MRIPLTDLNVKVKYSFVSSLGETENYRYLQQIVGEAWTEDDDGNELAMIGKIEADKLLISRTYDDPNWDPFHVFDTNQYLLELGESLYDAEGDYWDKRIMDYYQYDVNGSDLLVLTVLDLLPEYRGLGIAAKVIKDLYNNFISGAGLLVAYPTPIQRLPERFVEQNKAYYDAMQVEAFTKDEEVISLKYINYFRNLGFDMIKGLNERISIVNPMKLRSAFMEIQFG